MNKRLIGYWIATVLFCLAMTAGGKMNLLRVEPQQEAMATIDTKTTRWKTLAIETHYWIRRAP